jgi:hypothetical protein
MGITYLDLSIVKIDPALVCLRGISITREIRSAIEDYSTACFDEAEFKATLAKHIRRLFPEAFV